MYKRLATALRTPGSSRTPRPRPHSAHTPGRRPRLRRLRTPPPASARTASRPALVLVLLLALVTGPGLLLPTSTTEASAAPAVHLPRTSCSSLAERDFGTVATRIASAREVTVAGVANCQVDGTVAPRVGFRLNLPLTTWQGRYLQQGCGGYCGQKPDPGPSPSCDLQPGGDFATAASDSGHTAPSALDGSWGTDPQARVDFAERGPHVVAVAAKAVMRAFYGTGPRHSYFNGCSTGGRMALMEAQRHPTDFDGIVAGAPANLAAPLEGEFETWIARVNQDSTHSDILTADRLPALHRAVVAACDRRDGLTDGQIDDPRRCDFDPGTLRCRPQQDGGTGCLTAAQVTAARKLYQGPADPRGRRLYPGGMPYGSELAWPGWAVKGTSPTTASQALSDGWLQHLGFPLGAPASSFASWKFTVHGFDRLRTMGELYNATDPDLGAFRARGGKLILWHGWADSAIPPLGTVAYYDAVQRTTGGRTATGRFARLFMMPTVYHCSGGYGPSSFDTLNPIVHWVERGTAPERIVATQRDSTGNTVRTRPVFPYPARAVHRGTGSIDEAASFTPVTPPPAAPVDWVGKDLFAPAGPPRR
ncbi:tannase/feruloyl esterase family alpha/beta hydrolase [Streptomyces sp. NPDC087440]|uniref:tannase/feruloyl esterase family alpha/beta hydrolase n=1 Tax=Streptomyces sp. NPDC087440 TaxID=3365790 RepID=UPI0038290D70